ncbi:fibrinogen-like YCDxxxxGGGW domain-containing protein [Rothia nasimurium]|uniref:fibrinogen-like YCDxxxxGGGW domain-containing protein n=1 Tax=Rothia nasimurium TaxID=85336 RepID=UPI001F3D4E17|nr:fibrinogen-like YCDxxxxGGGW domain-containing protein [Rothia nasimurium]
MNNQNPSAGEPKQSTARHFWAAVGSQFKQPFSWRKPNTVTKVGVGALALATAVAVLPGATATDEYVPDGLTSQTAAASCYEIKLNDPESKSGTYWLWTPEMDAPAQFYCDQETHEGGWVLIGRGREGWTEDYAGKGNPAELAQNPDGTDAFSPVQLPAKTVDALMGHLNLQTMQEGTLVRRAGNNAGSAMQNVYLRPSKVQDWSWALSATLKYDFVAYDNPSNGSMGADASQNGVDGRINSLDNRFNNINFVGTKNQAWKIGFSYGSGVTGSNSPTSYLWSATNGGSNALPFSQVLIKPRLTQADLKLEDIADSGLPGSTQRALPASFSSRVTWRTAAQTATGKTGELNTFVQAITQVGNTVFTGGDFAWVENAATGEKVEQKFLAGYDVNTGELVRSFRPTFNGQIKALAELPGGLLGVGGEFSQVNGQPANGFVVLNPVTGEVDTSLGWDVVNRNAGGVPVVKSIAVDGNYVYIGGSFTHVKGKTSATYAYSKNAARFLISNKSVDWKWRPITNGTVNGISPSDNGVALGGYFTTVTDNKRSWKLAYLNTTDGKVAQDWTWKLSYREWAPQQSDGFQFDVQTTNSSVWAGGAEHMVAQYDKNNVSRRLTSTLTHGGGDYQDLHLNNGVLYAACHCGDWAYNGAQNYVGSWNDSTFTDVQAVRLLMAYDAETGQFLKDFTPNLRGARGHGVWASFVDSTGTLWAGGDITSSLGYNGVQKTVGFARFAPRDVTAPATASNLAVTTDGKTDTLTWTGVSERGVTYQILRNNRVIASTASTTLSLPATDDARYFVRVADTNGNYSATTPVATAPKVSEPAPEEPVEEAPVEEAPVEAPVEEAPVEQPQPETPVEAPAEEVAQPEAPAEGEPADQANEPVAPVEDQPADPAPAEEAPVEIVDQEEAAEEAAVPVEQKIADNPANGVAFMNPAPIAPIAQPAPGAQQVIFSGDAWNIAFGLDPWKGLDRTWRQTDYKYNTATWYKTYSSVGWGQPELQTSYQFNARNQPKSMMLRKELDLSLAPAQNLVLTTYVDDGMMLWVNGKQYTRQNLLLGATPAYTATRAVDFGVARKTPLVISIPAHELRQGKNSIAVMVNSNYAGAPTSFDMIGEVR